MSPVRATLSANQAVASFIVHNSSVEPAIVQLEAVSWSQQDGKDVYAPTKEILATPPIFTVPPGGSQVVRVGLRRSADPQRELTYRLFLQEVPSAKAGAQGLQVVLRIGIPIFVTPSAAAAPALRWRAARSAEGTLRLSAANEGNAHIQIAKTKLLLRDSAEVLATHELSAYVLPGQARDWTLKVPAVPVGTALRISAHTDAGDMHADVVVE